MLRVLYVVIPLFTLALVTPLAIATIKAQQACTEFSAMQMDAASTGDTTKQKEIDAKLRQCQRKASAAAVIGDAWLSVFAGKT